MSTRRIGRRIMLAIAILGILVIGTIQVVPGDPDPQVTNTPGNSMGDAEQNQIELLAQLDAAQSLIGGEWEIQDDPLPKVCMVDGVEGFTFTGIRRSTASADEGTRDAVAELWQGMGFETTRRDTVAPYKVLEASVPVDTGNVLRYGWSEVRTYLYGQGACGEGNAYSWLSEQRNS